MSTTLTTRQTAGTGATVKGSPLTNAEVDTNFINLNIAVLPAGGTAGQVLSKIDGTNFNSQWIDNYATQLKFQAKNTTGSTIPKGTVVYVSGGSGANPFISPAQANADNTSATTVGIVEADVVNNGFVLVVESGVISGVNTSAAVDGDPVWLSGTVAGGMIFGIANKPKAPIHIVYLGTVTRAHAVNGEIQVKVSNGWELDELHDVQITSVVNDQVLQYESASGLWKNKTLVTLPSQTGNSGKFLTTDGTNASWATVDLTPYLAKSGGTMTGAITFAAGQTWPTFNQNTTGTAAGLSATLAVGSGGTGLTGFTANGVVYASSTSALATGTGLQFDGTNLGLGVTPLWAGGKGFEIGSNGNALASVNSTQTTVSQNAYHNGTSWTYARTSTAVKYQQYAGTHTWQTAASGTAGAAITFTDAMTLDASARLVVGATAVSGSNQVEIQAVGTNTGLWVQTGQTSSSYNIADFRTGTNASALSLRADASSVFGGNVGIGTPSPATLLHLKSATSGAPQLRIEGSGADNGIITWLGGGHANPAVGIRYVSTGDSVGNLAFFANSASSSTLTERARLSAAGGWSVGTTADPGAGAIYATGNITAYYSSDAKFKENIQPITGATEIVKAIGADYFDWTDEYIADHGGEDGYFVQKADFGVIAQKVHKVFPKAVRVRKDGSLAVDYEKLGVLAFAALNEQEERITQLEQCVAELGN